MAKAEKHYTDIEQTQPIIVLELDREEAVLIRTLMGYISGGGVLREAADRIWKTLIPLVEPIAVGDRELYFEKSPKVMDKPLKPEHRIL